MKARDGSSVINITKTSALCQRSNCSNQSSISYKPFSLPLRNNYKEKKTYLIIWV